MEVKIKYGCDETSAANTKKVKGRAERKTEITNQNYSKRSRLCKLHSDDRAEVIASCVESLFPNNEKYFDCIEVKSNINGSFGVFSTKKIKPRKVFLTIPIRSIMRCTTLPSSIQEKFENMKEQDYRFRTIVEHHTLQNLPLWLCILASKFDCNSEFHSYAMSLPKESPCLMSWNKEDLDTYIGQTNAHSSTLNLLNDLQYVYEKALTLVGSFEEVLWARGMCVSRCFPATLIDENAVDGEACMIPFLDLMNHRRGTQVHFQIVENELCVSSNDLIASSEELFLNYGDDKSNETLLWSYGFCIQDNENDIFSFSFGISRENLESAKLTQSLLTKLNIMSTLKPDQTNLTVGPLHISHASLEQSILDLVLLMSVISLDEDDLPNPEQLQDTDIETTNDDLIMLINLLQNKSKDIQVKYRNIQAPSEGSSKFHISLYLKGLISILQEAIQYLERMMLLYESG